QCPARNNHFLTCVNPSNNPVAAPAISSGGNCTNQMAALFEAIRCVRFDGYGRFPWSVAGYFERLAIVAYLFTHNHTGQANANAMALSPGRFDAHQNRIARLALLGDHQIIANWRRAACIEGAAEHRAADLVALNSLFERHGVSSN